MKATTPATISESVLLLRSRIGISSVPVYVSVRPAPFAECDECFENVRKRVEQNGGDSVFGWCVWEEPGRLIEGAFHAIWKSPTGDLIDVTPTRDGETQILFLDDHTRQYQGVAIDNVRLALTNDRKLQRTIRLAKALAELRNKYNLPNGQAAVPAKEAYSVIMAKTSDNDPCPCGCGMKFKKCRELMSASERFSRWVRIASTSQSPFCGVFKSMNDS